MESISLSPPEPDGATSVHRAIAARASRRSFASSPVETDAVSHLLWAAQGVTHTRDGVEMRAAPSAGATYPLTVFLVANPGGAVDLSPGVYRYVSSDHSLEPHLDEVVRDGLTRAAGDQAVVRGAPVVLAVTADFERTRREYPGHGDRYVHVEAGHVAENVHLVCESREMNTCPVGAFDDDEVAAVLDLPDSLAPLYLLPVGNR